MAIDKFVELRRIKSKIQFLDNCIKRTKIRINLHNVTQSDMYKTFGYRDKILETLTEELEKLENEKEKLQTKTDIILEKLSGLPKIVLEVAIYKEVYLLSWVQISGKTGYSCEEIQKFYKEAEKFHV